MGHKQSIIIGYFQDDKSIRQLSRDLGLNRRTVKKYIKEHEALQASSEEDQLSCGTLDPPTYQGGKRHRSALTDEVLSLLEGYEAKNAVHRAAGRHKQQMKRTDMLEALQQAGHQIGYSSVCRGIKEIRSRGQEAFIRQVYSPGQESEFDWGEVELVINGQPKRHYLAVFTLAYSNHRWAMLFHRQDMISFLTAHQCYFSHLGGVPGRVSYDNMRTAVARFVHRDGRRDKEATEDLLRLSAYYVFDFRFCNVRRGNEKGHVERSVEYLRRKAFSNHIDFESIAAANEYLLKRCGVLNERPVRGKEVTIAQQLEEERSVMRPLPALAFDPGQVTQKRVDKYSCVAIDTNHYSVPDDRVGRFVEVRIYALHIEVYDAAAKRFLVRHQRHPTKHCYYVELTHFLPTLRRKPGALLGALAWQQADGELRAVFHQYFEPSQIKSFIDAMIWVDKQGFNWQQVKQTLDRAKSAQPQRQISLDTFKALLLCQSEKAAAPLTEVPTAPPSVQQQAIKDRAARQLQAYQTLFAH